MSNLILEPRYLSVGTVAQCEQHRGARETSTAPTSSRFDKINLNWFVRIFFKGTTSMTLKFNYPFCGRLGKRFEGLVLHEVRLDRFHLPDFLILMKSQIWIFGLATHHNFRILPVWSFFSFFTRLVWSTPKRGQTGTIISSRWMVALTLMMILRENWHISYFRVNMEAVKVNHRSQYGQPCQSCHVRLNIS